MCALQILSLLLLLLERQRTRHRAELTSRKRHIGETVAELGLAMRKLVRRAYPDCGST